MTSASNPNRFSTWKSLSRYFLACLLLLSLCKVTQAERGFYNGVLFDCGDCLFEDTKFKVHLGPELNGTDQQVYEVVKFINTDRQLTLEQTKVGNGTEEYLIGPFHTFNEAEQYIEALTLHFGTSLFWVVAYESGAPITYERLWEMCQAKEGKQPAHIQSTPKYQQTHTFSPAEKMYKISGVVYEDQQGVLTPVSDVRIEIQTERYKTGRIVGQTNAQGRYEFFVPMKQRAVQLLFAKDSYKHARYVAFIPAQTPTLNWEADIFLQSQFTDPQFCHAVEGTVFDDETNLPLAGVDLKILDLTGNVLATATTTSQGRYMACVPKQSVYIVECIKEGYLFGSTSVNVNTERSVAQVSINPRLMPYEEQQTEQAIAKRSKEELKMREQAWLDQNSLTVYPNPTNAYVNYQYQTTATDPIILELLNIDGQTMEQVKVQPDRSTISGTFNLQSYPAGVYILKASPGKSRGKSALAKYQKIVKLR